MNESLVVSVCMITYNHATFVSEAIESVLKQNTRFEYELIISDDCSSDSTYEICEAYQKQYPEKIRLIRHNPNIGVCRNFFSTLAAAKGKYVAICEGDDYWIHPYKLQLQVDYMESHSDTVLTYHNAEVGEKNKFSPFINLNIPSHQVDLEELLSKWAIPTASVLYRRESFVLPSDFPWFINGDYSLELLLKAQGKFYYEALIMSVYRKHTDSVSVKLDATRVQSLNGIINLLSYMKKKYVISDQNAFDVAICKYQSWIRKEEKQIKYPFLKFFSWRYYKRKLFSALKIKRISE